MVKESRKQPLSQLTHYLDDAKETDFDSLRELTKSSNRLGTLRRYGKLEETLRGGLNYFLKTVFNYLILTECYKVAAYNAANKLASVRHAARAADPSVPAEPSAPVVVAGR